MCALYTQSVSYFKFRNESIMIYLQKYKIQKNFYNEKTYGNKHKIIILTNSILDVLFGLNNISSNANFYI